MTILEKLFLVLQIPLASIYLSTILITDLLFIESLYSYSISEIYGGLFQSTLLSQIPFTLGGFSLEEPNILLSVFVPIMIYSNDNLNKLTILSDNKDKAAIYMWTHKESGKRYVGSAVNFSKRMNNYFKKGYLERNITMYIYNALLLHGYSAFTLTILEYIDIANLSKEDAKILILEREQFYLDVIFSEDEPNTYNILKIAGSSLGYKHTEGSLSKKTGENHHMFGKTGEAHPFFGRNHSSEAIAKISIAKGGGTIYVYDLKGSLVNTFNSTREAGKFFNCSHVLIYKYLKNGKLFKKQWILSTLNKE